jgi:hypothetical protein
MRRALALGLAFCGFLIAAFLMVRIAWTLRAPGYRPVASIWPFPGVYLLEVVALAFCVFLAILARGPRALSAAWMAIGALSALALLGAMTIGSVIGVSVLVLAPATLLGEETIERRVGRDAAAFVLGLLAQAVGMFVIIQAMLLR